MNPFQNLLKIASITNPKRLTCSALRPQQQRLRSRSQPYGRVNRLMLWLLALLFTKVDAHASIFQGETLDKVADVMTWVVLIVAPIVGITVFLLIHILPEKIAEKRQHPQAKAIQCLCLLSLVFGGMLWPLAWLWAYTRPVLHRMAYGHDRLEHEETVPETLEPEDVDQELKQLWARVHELEAKQHTGSGEKGKV